MVFQGIGNGKRKKKTDIVIERRNRRRKRNNWRAEKGEEEEWRENLVPELRAEVSGGIRDWREGREWVLQPWRFHLSRWLAHYKKGFFTWINVECMRLYRTTWSTGLWPTLWLRLVLCCEWSRSPPFLLFLSFLFNKLLDFKFTSESVVLWFCRVNF